MPRLDWSMFSVDELMRRKSPFLRFHDASDLTRQLTGIDVFLLGIHSTIGAGIWILSTGPTGWQTRCVTGTVWHFFFYIVAGILWLLALLSSAEYAALVPRTGGPYTSAYLHFGELPAFILGINSLFSDMVMCALETAVMTEHILHNVKGAVHPTCSFNDNLSRNANLTDCWKCTVGATFIPVAAHGSQNFSCSNSSAFCDHTIEAFWNQSCEKDDRQILLGSDDAHSREDYLALGLVVALALIMTLLKTHYSLRGAATMLAVELACMVLVVSAGVWHLAKRGSPVLRNWPRFDSHLAPVPAARLIATLKTPYFTYIGTDSIILAAEETRNPRRVIPAAIVASVAAIMLCYGLMSGLLTLLVPHYAVSDLMSLLCALRAAMGMSWVRWVYRIGAMIAMILATFTCLYRASRVVFAMARDRLLFSALDKVNKRTKTPASAVATIGAVIAVSVWIVPTAYLFEISSMERLISLSVASAATIMLRYERSTKALHYLPKDFAAELVELHKPGGADDNSGRLRRVFQRVGWLSARNGGRTPILCAVILNSACALAFGLVIGNYGLAYGPSDYAPGPELLIGLLAVLWLLSALLILAHERNCLPDVFKVPLVPLVPLVSISFNMVILTQVSLEKWQKILPWILLALVIYAFYGYRNSKEMGARSGRRRPDAAENDTPDDPNTNASRPISSNGTNDRTDRVSSLGEPSSSIAMVPLPALAPKLFGITRTEFNSLPIGDLIKRVRVKLQNFVIDRSFILMYPGHPLNESSPKGNHSRQSNADMIREALLVKSVSHPNIRPVVGVVYDPDWDDVLIAMEYKETTLLEYMTRRSNDTITAKDQFHYALQVATGMQKFNEAKPPLVHRDLKIDNILYHKGKLMIADLGLARMMVLVSEASQNADPSYKIASGSRVELPVRITPPECFGTPTFNQKTDVFSYGFLLFDIFTFGRETEFDPFRREQNLPSLEATDDPGEAAGNEFNLLQQKLEAYDCPDPAIKLIKACLNRIQSDRPTFAKICERLTAIICQPDVVRL